MKSISVQSFEFHSDQFHGSIAPSDDIGLLIIPFPCPPRNKTTPATRKLPRLKATRREDFSAGRDLISCSIRSHLEMVMVTLQTGLPNYSHDG